MSAERFYHSHQTHCALRLGDNLAALHFLRALVRHNPGHIVTHSAHAEYLPQLQEMIQDEPRISLASLRPAMAPEKWMARPTTPSVDLWKNADGFFDKHENKNTYSKVMLDFFASKAEEMGLQPALTAAKHLLFDYPALRRNEDTEEGSALIINSPPLSNQAARYRQDEMDALALEIAWRHPIITTRKIPGHRCTAELGYTVSAIGRLSQVCPVILMVSTGPSWPTFNIWNQESVKLRIIINEPETVDLDPNAVQVHTVSEAASTLKERGYR